MTSKEINKLWAETYVIGALAFERVYKFAALIAAAEREKWTVVAEQAVETLKNNRRTHYYCEDKWYSCPKHEEGCANDDAGVECDCGADKANEEIDAVIVAITAAIRARGESK
jgi:hypothetical protein